MLGLVATQVLGTGCSRRWLTRVLGECAETASSRATKSILNFDMVLSPSTIAYQTIDVQEIMNPGWREKLHGRLEHSNNDCAGQALS